MSEMVDTTDLVEEIELAEEEQHKVNGNFEEVNEDEIQLDENDAIMDMDEEDEEDEIKSPDDYDLIEKSIIEEDVSMRSPEQNNDNEEDIVEGFDDIITEDDNNEEDESELKLNEDNNSVSDSGYNKVNSVESCDKARMDENSSSVRGDDGVGGDESQENSRETPSLQSNGTGGGGGGGGGKRKRDNEELIEEIYDDDKPVSIPSDSNSEDEDNKRLNNKTNGKCDSPEIHEILSDKEDCVVIEDSVSPVKGMNSMERRQRKNPARMREVPSYDDDIEEIIEDPIAINSTTTIQPVMKKAKLSLPASTQLTLNDANGNRTDVSITPSTKGGQNSGKEPTVMFIDTQSILNNRNNSTNSRTATNSPGSLAANLANLNKNSPGFSISPVTNTGLLNSSSNSPGTYPTNIKATITPINSKSTTTTNSNSNTKASSATPIQQLPSLSATQANGGSNILLPALTDDMFVLEAPSFIVPYIYEKPPSENLKTLVGAMGVELAEQKKKSGHGGGQHTDKDSDGEKIKLNASGVANKEQGQQEAGKRDEEGGDGKKKKKSRKGKNPDDSWDESDTSTDEEASDSETRTKVLIKEVNPDIESIILPQEGGKAAPVVQETKQTNPDNYFESPLGNFFMSIGVNLVQEHVQTDLLRIQKRKQIREGNKPSAHVQTAINALMKNLEVSRNTNRPFKFSNKRCEFCNFKAESALIMANHYEKPHLKGNNYRCNFCTFEARPAHDILFHMEAVHNVKSKLDKPLCYHQCPNCPFEDNGKSKLARHTLACAKKFMPETNLTPPPDWDPPAKIPRIKPRHGLVGTATAYQAMAAQQQRINAAAAGIMNRMNLNNLTNVNNINTNTIGLMNNSNLTNLNANATGMTGTTPKGRGRNSGGGSRAGGGGNRQGSMRPQITPDMMQNYNHLAAAAVKHLSNSQLMQMAANQAMLPNTHNSLTIQTSGQGSKSSKNMQQPSISITPLPRGGAASVPALQAAQAAALKSGMPSIKPGQHPSGSKSTFVICEICDGYIKDLDQLRSHMQLIHKVKIHPKMIYNRPPLNCQKCQYRFFTDQGLERHLLGSHGLVTSSMQEAANCGQDSGRCPVCGRVYQWKLLNHVSRDHNMTLKPAHLSYKCTVCTATFGMYKQFENHVYSAHSTVAKKSGDSKRGSSSTSSSSNNNSSFGGSSKNSGDAILKPLKINDEITIIPQPPTKASMTKTQTIEIE